MVLAVAGLAGGCAFSPKALLELSREDQQVTFLQRSVRMNPENAHARFMLGKEYLRNNHPKQASREFEKALAIQPGLEEARFGLGVAYLEMESWSRAEKTYEELAGQFPDAIAAWEGLAYSRLSQEDLEGTVEAVERARAIAPDSPRVRVLLGELAYIQGNYEQALEHWDSDELSEESRTRLMPIIRDLEDYVRTYR